MEGMRKMSPFRIQNGRLPCARKCGNATVSSKRSHYTKKRPNLNTSEHDTESIGMSTWSCSCVSSGCEAWTH